MWSKSVIHVEDGAWGRKYSRGTRHFRRSRGRLAKGALSPGVMATSDCKADHDTLAERGVEFTQPHRFTQGAV
jgi:hypothetical protein